MEKVSVDQITNVPINSDAFPEEYDKDGDGKVYIISQGESVAYMDEKEYLAWGKQIFWMPEMKIDWCELGGNLACDGQMNYSIFLFLIALQVQLPMDCGYY